MALYTKPIEGLPADAFHDATPVVPGTDPLDVGLSDADRRENDLADARKVLATLRRSATEVTTLAPLVEPLSERIERADKYHLSAEEAEHAVKAATRARDGAEAAALRVPNGDPVATAAGAQKELDEALSRAENTNRLANTTVMIAASDARAARSRIKGDYRANAERLTRERLRAFEAERVAAIEAVREAQRRIHRATSSFAAVRGIANQLDEENELRTLVGTSRFDGSSQSGV
ncbi:hypothetical protein [Nocardiopsis nanhaiensis]